MFLHWVELYDWAFSLPETDAPHESVVENDQKFDIWLENYINRMRTEQRRLKSGHSSKSASQHDTVFNFDGE